MAAVSSIGKPLTSGVVVDETWYSDPEFCEKSKLWHMLSKTLAEKAAWEFAKENGIDLFVIGPFLQPTVNLTVETILNFVNTGRRYCVEGEVVHRHDALKFLRDLYPALHLPEKCEDEKPFSSKYEISRKKAEALGVNFTPLAASLRDTIECLKEKGYVSV